MPKSKSSNVARLAAEVKALKLASRAVKVVKRAKRASKAGKNGGFFGSIGKSLGGAAGGFLGGMATKALMTITGMGDYKVQRNSLYVHALSSSPPPAFRSDSHSTRVVHREFIGDVVGSIAFSKQYKFPINPASALSFPWLSTMAVLFEEYKFHGLVFEFKSTSGSAISSTNAALGTVMMATQYNVYLPDFVTKVQMDAYEYTVATKPDCSALHPIECDPKLNDREVYFIDTSQFAAGGDLRMTNMGNFYLYTAGQQADANTIGELWVTYDVELLKPRLMANAAGASEANSAFYYNSDQTTAGAQGPFVSSGADLFRGVRLLPDSLAGNNLTSIRPSTSNFPISFGTATGGDPNIIYFPPGFRGKVLFLVTMRISIGTSVGSTPSLNSAATAPPLTTGVGLGVSTQFNFDHSTLVPGAGTAADTSYGTSINTQNGANYFFRYILWFDGTAGLDPVTGRSQATIKLSSTYWTANGTNAVTWANSYEFYPVFL